MSKLKKALNKKADLAMMQTETLCENLKMVEVSSHGEQEWISFCYGDGCRRSSKTALKRQILELRDTLQTISKMLDY